MWYFLHDLAIVMDKQRGLLLLNRFIIVFLYILLPEAATSVVVDCGGYISAGSGNSGQMTSPNYPGNYASSTKCIWLIETVNGSVVELTISHLVAQNGINSAGCEDYLEVRDGSKTASLRYFGCSLSQSLVLQSSSRWLWLKFYSNHDSTVNSGFSASWTVIAGGPTAVNVSSPVKTCRNYLLDYTCHNKECVDTAYLCDGDNDCGCLRGCDEDCAGTSYSVEIRLMMGTLIGLGVFLIPFIIIGVLETSASMKREKKRKEDERTRGTRDRKFLNLTMATVQKTALERSLSSSGNFEKGEFVTPLNTNLLEVPSLSTSFKTSTPKPPPEKDSDKVQTTVIQVPPKVVEESKKTETKVITSHT